MNLTDPNDPAPAGLSTEEFILRPIAAGDAELDHAAVVETRDWLRIWEQSSWPVDGFTVEANREDLVGLERRHSEHLSFTYTVLRPDGSECLGCVYIFPTSAPFLAKSTVTPLGDDAWTDVDAVVYFWARLTEMERGTDERLLAALRSWFDGEWKLATTVYVTNEQFTPQVELIERAGLTRKFELREPDKAGAYLVYG